MAVAFDNCISDEQYEAIVAEFPKCPTCGRNVSHITHQVTTIHSLDFQVDGMSGDVLIYESSEAYDRLDDEHVRDDTPTGAYLVQCAAGHDWYEPRLRYESVRLAPGRFVMEWQLVPAGA